MRYILTFDAANGVYRVPVSVEEPLLAEAKNPGPMLPWGSVDLMDPPERPLNYEAHVLMLERRQGALCEVLVRQARLLLSCFPSAVPRLRFGLPANHGRDCGAWWWHGAYMDMTPVRTRTASDILRAARSYGEAKASSLK